MSNIRCHLFFFFKPIFTYCICFLSFLSDLSSSSNCSGCLDVTLYSEEISRLKREFEDIQRMILGQEQVRPPERQRQPQTAVKFLIKKQHPSILAIVPHQVLDQASQAQATLRTTSSRLMRDMQNHIMSIKVLNQSLERYMDQVEGWKDVIEETEEKMKTMTEDQYDIKATAQQVNTTVALRWISQTRHIQCFTCGTMHVGIDCVIHLAAEFFIQAHF